MYSNPNSRSNSELKLFHRRRRSTPATPIGDVGDDLYVDDLDWDRSDFSRCLPESDALSSYDVNEMAEIFRHRFLDFDMSSQVGLGNSLSRQSTISNCDLTIEQFLQTRSTPPTAPLTFDIDSLCEHSLISRPFHRSLSTVKINSCEPTKLLTRHLSLMDVPSIEWTFLRHATPRALLLTRGNYRTSFTHLSQSMEGEPSPLLSSSKTSLNLSRLSRLAMIRLYMKRLREKLCSFVLQTIQSPPTPTTTGTRMPAITEETIETYDIIEE